MQKFNCGRLSKKQLILIVIIAISLLIALFVPIFIYAIVPEIIRSSLSSNDGEGMLLRKLEISNITDTSLNFDGLAQFKRSLFIGTAKVSGMEVHFEVDDVNAVIIKINDIEIPLIRDNSQTIAGKLEVTNMNLASKILSEDSNCSMRTNLNINVLGLKYRNIQLVKKFSSAGKDAYIPKFMRPLALNQEIRKKYGSAVELIPTGNNMPDIYFKDLKLRNLSNEILVFEAAIEMENPISINIEVDKLTIHLGTRTDVLLQIDITNPNDKGYYITYPDPLSDETRIQSFSMIVRMTMLGNGNFISKLIKLSANVSNLNLIGPIDMITPSKGNLFRSITEKTLIELPAVNGTFEKLSKLFIKKFGLSVLGSIIGTSAR